MIPGKINKDQLQKILLTGAVQSPYPAACGLQTPGPDQGLDRPPLRP